MPLQNKLLKILEGKEFPCLLIVLEEAEVSSNKYFKTRVKEAVINGAIYYNKFLVEYDYLICSEAFTKKKFYIIQGERTNYKHLTGVLIGTLSADGFFGKCMSGLLKETDFDIAKDANDKATKGTIRRKIAVLEDAVRIFESSTLVEEGFAKNRIKCAVATAKGTSTIGFELTGVVLRPKTLLKGNELDMSKAKPVELVLRRKRGAEYFAELIVGDQKVLEKYKSYIADYLEPDFK